MKSQKLFGADSCVCTSYRVKADNGKILTRYRDVFRAHLKIYDEAFLSGFSCTKTHNSQGSRESEQLSL